MREKETGQAGVPERAKRAFLKMSNVPKMVVAPLKPEEGVAHGYLVEQGLSNPNPNPNPNPN